MSNIQIDTAIDLMYRFVVAYSNDRNIEGIVLLGGMGKRFDVDQFSDLDVSIILSVRDTEKMPPFSFFCPDINGVAREFNVYQATFDDFSKGPWDEGKIQAYENRIIVLDRYDRINTYIQKEIDSFKPCREEIMVLIDQYSWFVNHHAVCLHKRNDHQSSHLLINQGINLLIRLIYKTYSQPIPHVKWQLRNIQHIKGAPSMIAKNIGAALVTKNFSWGELRRRQDALNLVFDYIIRILEDRRIAYRDSAYEFVSTQVKKRQMSLKPFSRNAKSWLKEMSIPPQEFVEGICALNRAETKESLAKLLNHKPKPTR